MSSDPTDTARRRLVRGFPYENSDRLAKLNTLLLVLVLVAVLSLIA